MKEEEVVISVLTIQGLVQSVGFRPFIYRIASEMNICGEVDNRNNGGLYPYGPYSRATGTLHRTHTSRTSEGGFHT